MDIISRLYDAANEDEADTIRDVALRAGVLWRCAVPDTDGDPCGYDNAESDPVCGYCQAAKPAETRPLKRWWVSWYDPSENRQDRKWAWELRWPWWVSGYECGVSTHDRRTICAALLAPDEDGACEIIYAAYDRRPENLEFRFVNARPDDWQPFCERFPGPKPWMLEFWPAPSDDAKPAEVHAETPEVQSGVKLADGTILCAACEAGNCRDHRGTVSADVGAGRKPYACECPGHRS